MKIRLSELRRVIQNTLNESLTEKVQQFVNQGFAAAGMKPPLMKKRGYGSYAGAIDKAWKLHITPYGGGFIVDLNNQKEFPDIAAAIEYYKSASVKT